MGLGRIRRSIRCARPSTSHILRLRLGPEVKKEDIKVRSIKPGWLEIEWRRATGEEIPVE